MSYSPEREPTVAGGEGWLRTDHRSPVAVGMRRRRGVSSTITTTRHPPVISLMTLTKAAVSTVMTVAARTPTAPIIAQALHI